MKKIILITIIAFIFPLKSYAGVIENKYQTKMEKSSWEFSGNIFHCEISHQVDGFGDFMLTATPGDELFISLTADWLSLRDHASEIIIESSSWQQQNNAPFAQSELNWQGHTAKTSRNSAAFLEALEQGLTWQVNIDPGKNIKYKVNSSPVSTRAIVREFRLCKQNLLPKPFSYVRRVDMQFNSNSTHLSPENEQDLIAIARYIAADDNVTEVLIDGHADASGDHFVNLQLSKERAYEVQARLIELGVPNTMIQVRHHGTRTPIASNNSSQGRELNRRVMVRLVKTNNLTALKTQKASR
ncbi:OmpA family protein [Shewanella sp. ENK2]|uniref:MotY family protein n=1 Tax=Shewanella sp. ENK2 TaxID=2775245 RepID=UPI003747E697